MICALYKKCHTKKPTQPWYTKNTLLSGKEIFFSQAQRLCTPRFESAFFLFFQFLNNSSIAVTPKKSFSCLGNLPAILLILFFLQKRAPPPLNSWNLDNPTMLKKLGTGLGCCHFELHTYIVILSKNSPGNSSNGHK